ADRAAAAEVVAEIDQPVVVVEPLGDAIMQPAQSLPLAMHRGDRPDPSRRAQPGEFIVFHASACPAAPARPPCLLAVAAQAESSCSTRWTAVPSSIRSTAAN